MKAKLLRVAGKIRGGTEVEIGPRTGTHEVRSETDLGGQSTTPSPVYEVTDEQGNAENVDTRDLFPLSRAREGSHGWAGVLSPEGDDLLLLVERGGIQAA